MCLDKGEYSVECLETKYAAYATDPLLEWFNVASQWFWNQALFAWLGWYYWWDAWFISIIIVLFPESYPSISTGGNWDKLEDGAWERFVFDSVI